MVQLLLPIQTTLHTYQQSTDTFTVKSCVDGAVPSVNSGVSSDGKPGKHWENWQQGVAVVWYNEETGRFAVELVHIIEGAALYQGQEFVSSASPAQTQP